MTTVRLQSSDGVNFEVDLRAAKGSKLIKEMLDDLGNADNDKDLIPVSNVNSRILEKVIEWLIYHKDDIIPEVDSSDDDDDDDGGPNNRQLSKWEDTFLSVDHRTLSELMLAAYYLDVKKLLQTCCKKQAALLSNKTPEEIREMCNLKDGLTPEQKEMIKFENEICELFGRL